METASSLARHFIAYMMVAATVFDPAYAQSCDYGECVSYPNTTILNLRKERLGAGELERVKMGGYELANGTFQTLGRWYAGNLITTRADFVTLFAPNFGLLWGASTGENAQKYKLQPAVRLGLIALGSIGANARLSLSAHTTIAGRLRERPCTADYGDVGGVQEVNCRLAASELPPQETLQYLWNIPRPDQMQITLRLTLGF